jgi:hypothetical protein
VCGILGAAEHRCIPERAPRARRRGTQPRARARRGTAAVRRAGDRARHAHLLLAPLAADLVGHLHDDEGVTPEALIAGLERLLP